jgi:gamma-glutamyltranspeptidase/glutathione hydrolase
MGDPISTTYRDWHVYEIPPNTQGIAALMMLDLMEQFPLREYGFASAPSLHVLIEAKKLAYADMLHYVADPRFGAVPVGELLDKAAARARARLIRPESAAARVKPSVVDSVTTRYGGDTIYLSAIDREGNIVSLIQSIYQGFGSGLVPSGTGFALQNRGALFTLDEQHPNVLAPRKRPLHTIIPGSCRRAASASASASWAPGIRRKPTRSSSPTSSTTGWISRRRSKPRGSRRAHSTGWTSASKR